MKYQTQRDIEKAAAEVVSRCLGDVPFLEAEEVDTAPPTGSIQPDAVLVVRTRGRTRLLLIEARASGHPRFAREAVNQLVRLRERRPDATSVFVAPFITPRSAEICREAGVGYVDLAGNCFLTFDHVYIRREGRANPFAARRDLRSLYSPKGERILRALLTNPKRSWKTEELAREAQVSVGQVSNIRRLLSHREWLVPGRFGIMLSEPAALLEEWAQAYDPTRSTPHMYYSMKEPREVEASLSLLCLSRSVRFALTGFAAASRIAPYSRSPQAEAYVACALSDLTATLDLREVASGANVRLIEPYDEGVFYGCVTVDNVPLVSSIQVYLDLRATGGRGEDAARFLLEEVIARRW